MFESRLVLTFVIAVGLHAASVAATSVNPSRVASGTGVSVHRNGTADMKQHIVAQGTQTEAVHEKGSWTASSKSAGAFNDQARFRTTAAGMEKWRGGPVSAFLRPCELRVELEWAGFYSATAQVAVREDGRVARSLPSQAGASVLITGVVVEQSLDLLLALSDYAPGNPVRYIRVRALHSELPLTQSGITGERGAPPVESTGPPEVEERYTVTIQAVPCRQRRPIADSASPDPAMPRHSEPNRV